jgi:pilus assembly protein CpaB
MGQSSRRKAGPPAGGERGTMQSRIVAILVAIVLAVMATMALVVYVHSADRRAINDRQPVLVYVARQKIPQGTFGSRAYNAGWIQQKALPAVAVASDAIRSVDQIAGRVAAVNIYPGEQLISVRWVSPDVAEGQHLLQIPPDMQAISIQVDATRQVSGFITPGDHVSILATVRKGGGPNRDQPTTGYLLQDVTVLAVGGQAQVNPAAQGSARANNRAQGLTTITVALSPSQMPNLVAAIEGGSLYFTLLPPGQKIQPNVRSIQANQ